MFTGTRGTTYAKKCLLRYLYSFWNRFHPYFYQICHYRGLDFVIRWPFLSSLLCINLGRAIYKMSTHFHRLTKHCLLNYINYQTRVTSIYFFCCRKTNDCTCFMDHCVPLPFLPLLWNSTKKHL